MIRAVVKNGGLELLDPLPSGLNEGREIQLELISSVTSNEEPSEQEINNAFDFLDDPANAMDEAEFSRMMTMLEQQRQMDRQAMRKYMDSQS